MVEGARFQLFGFPVTIRPGFVVIIALIAFLYGGSLGPWLAGSLAVFTLVHELGHAVDGPPVRGRPPPSRWTCSTATRSVRPSRPLARWERALIAVAGPAIEIILGLAVLLAMGADPLSFDSVTDSPGPLRHLVGGPGDRPRQPHPRAARSTAARSPRSASTASPRAAAAITMMYVSLGLAAVGLPGARSGTRSGGLRSSIVALIAVSNLHELRQHRRGDEERRLRSPDAHGRPRRRGAGVGLGPPRPVPARRAPVALVPGPPAAAGPPAGPGPRPPLASLEDGPDGLAPPRGPTLDQLRALVALLPHGAADGQPLRRPGPHLDPRAGRRARSGRRPTAPSLYRAHPQRLDRPSRWPGRSCCSATSDDAVGWLRLAAQRWGDREALRDDPDLAGLRNRADVVALLERPARPS